MNDTGWTHTYCVHFADGGRLVIGRAEWTRLDVSLSTEDQRHFVTLRADGSREPLHRVRLGSITRIEEIV